MRRYRLYIDESGDHTYNNLDSTGNRYLCLLGVFIREKDYKEVFHPELELLKQTHFPNAPKNQIILHRRDIIDKKGHFGVLTDSNKKQAFDGDMLSFFSNQQYKIIGVVIDKKTHIERYGRSAFHPYHYCMSTMLERYAGFLNYCNGKGDVVVERRGGNEDTQLKEAYLRTYNSGTSFHRSDFFQNTLTSNEIKIKPKNANIAGLQLADLLASPVRQSILIDNGVLPSITKQFTLDLFRRIEIKYNRRIDQNRIQGYGKIFLR